MSVYREIFKALSDPTRLRILAFLNNDLEHPCKDVSRHFNLAQPTMCHHFRVLKNAGLIESRRRGTSVCYQLRREYLAEMGLDLERMLQRAPAEFNPQPIAT